MNGTPGIALINLLNKRGLGTPVLVVSAMPAAVYRSIMKALDAWDYLQKNAVDEIVIETVLALLRQTTRPGRPCGRCTTSGARTR